MARKLRVELEGGLYHVISRGNNRAVIFHEPDDYSKFLALLEAQKRRLPFFLYAYCLMPNHVHLLIERQADAVGRIMHRLLTGYSQYYNRKYGKSGHLLQGRHKAILCQTDRYLCELVRYIHLNPVRAKMVARPEQYPYSSHRAYLGMARAGIVDVDPVLRHFGVDKKAARARFAQFVVAGLKLGHRAELYLADDGRILGTEEFIEATIHRLGETDSRSDDRKKSNCNELNVARLLAAVEKACQLSREEFCGPGKGAAVTRAKEVLIVAGRRAGMSVKMLAKLIGISSASVSRRYDAALSSTRQQAELSKLIARVHEHYRKIKD